ncbi:MAG: hypothetical protein EKK63_12275 [Acinetobacter sp.]|uniref:hypothetical protein n=1 Tax=Acinetobacter sp. TaxID=472 RepID=UPI000FBD205B|nr:hypothetical protein [Acinetobacter sp.]RUP38440.1 MAG: hypothetical protein EKK63_12275 [Acinetobacter sp.]
MATKPITSAQFETLMEELCGYFCKGWGRNVNASDEEWDTLHFEYDGSKSLGLEFHLAHPYSRVKDAIDYDMIELRFSAKYPFPQEWGYRITDKVQIQRLKNAVAEPYRQYREFKDLGKRAQTTRSSAQV